MHDTRPSLILRVKDPQDAASWREFVDLYQPLIVRYARRSGLGEHDAQDVAQDILVTLLRVLPTFELDCQKRFRGWLARVVYNATMTWQRRRQRHNRMLQAMRDEELQEQLVNGEEPPAEWLDDCRRRALEFAMEQVRKRTESEVKWKCFEQHVLCKRPAAEVSHELGITTNHVFVNASRVLQHVRAQCEQYLEHLADD